MTPSEKLHHGRLAAFSLLLLLMAFMSMEILLKPLPAGAKAVLAGIALLPLLPFLAPLRRGNPGSALWLSMMLMPYFCWAALGAFAPRPDGMLALLRAVLIGACFTALMLMVRWSRQAATSADAGATTSTEV